MGWHMLVGNPENSLISWFEILVIRSGIKGQLARVMLMKKP
jgi:hypothetical protein